MINIGANTCGFSNLLVILCNITCITLQQNMFLSVTEEEGDTKLTVNCLYPSAMDCATRGLAVKEGNILIKTLSTASTKPQCQSAEPADKQAMILALDVLTAQVIDATVPYCN